MQAELLRRTLRAQRRGLLGWSLGLALLGVYVVAVYPSIRSLGLGRNRLLAELPSALRAMIGGQLDFTTPTGFLQTEVFFITLPAMMLVLGIAAGSRAVAGEEERGTMDLLLSTPLSRPRLVLEKTTAMAVGIAAVSLVFSLALLVATRVARVDVSVGGMLAATFSAGLLGLLFGVVALLVGCLRGRRGPAVATATAIAVAAYLLNSLGGLVGALQPYRKLSPFYWYIDNQPLSNGLDVGHLAALLGVSAMLTAAAVWAFARRDVGV